MFDYFMEPFKCVKVLNLLRVLAHTSWGADQETPLPLHLYRSLRSKLDYGCVVYGSARPSYYVCLILYRTMPFGYASVLLEPLHAPVSMLKLMNLHSTLDDDSSCFCNTP